MTSIGEKIPVKTKVLAFLFMTSISFCASCRGVQANGPTMAPLPMSTLVPTQTSTPASVPLADSPVPRLMILDQPGRRVEILGEDWNYTNDRWGETFACMDYTRASPPHVFLEECFVVIQPNLTLESEREKYLSDNYEVLKPNNTFGNTGQIIVMAIGLQDSSGKRVKVFELLAVQNYLLRVEINIATDDTSPLQRIYEEQAADIIEYVLENMLEKSHLVPRPTATPLFQT